MNMPSPAYAVVPSGKSIHLPEFINLDRRIYHEKANHLQNARDLRRL